VTGRTFTKRLPALFGVAIRRYGATRHHDGDCNPDRGKNFFVSHVYFLNPHKPFPTPL
jgi:hypothetical protein